MDFVIHIKQQAITKVILFLMALVILPNTSMANPHQGELKRIMSLEGKWKFSIGDREEWRYYDYDDREWDNIYVPGAWEDQGFHGYNGFATYRKDFEVDESFEGLMLYLGLGYIDDVDEVFVNGHLVGSTGSFPPRFETAYNAKRRYYLPDEFINFKGRNTITVVVYDSHQAGGIVKGDVGIYTTEFGMKVDISLQGKWKFHLKDNLDWADAGYDDSSWEELFVPGKWEDQMYRNYDGFAWYRKTFRYTQDLGDYLVLLLGRIDDLDQVFINGQLVGSTGDFGSGDGRYLHTDQQYRAFRGYYLPKAIFKPDQYNVIAVRVYDKHGGGGIYEGPVGIISQDNYINYWKKKKYSR